MKEQGSIDFWTCSYAWLQQCEVDGGRHEVVKYLVEKKAETNWLVRGPTAVSL